MISAQHKPKMVAMKEGDWFCLQCRDLNFASRDDCRSCGAKRTHDPDETNPDNMMDADAWLQGYEIDEDKKQQFLSLSHERQQLIIIKGPLHGCKDPTAVLVSRLNALPPDPEAANAPVGKSIGTVKSYSVFKGYGFIIPDNPDEKDIFLHLRAVVDGSTPKAGDRLTFDLEPAADTDVDNQLKAVNVRGGTGYPLTDDQKGETKGKGKGKGKEDGGKSAKSAGKDKDRGGPYGKGYGGALGPSSYDDSWGYGKGWDKGYYGGWDGGKGYYGPWDYYGGKGWDGGKGKGWDDWGKGWDAGKGWGYDSGKGWDGGKAAEKGKGGKKGKSGRGYDYPI